MAGAMAGARAACIPLKSGVACAIATITAGKTIANFGAAQQAYQNAKNKLQADNAVLAQTVAATKAAEAALKACMEVAN